MQVHSPPSLERREKQASIGVVLEALRDRINVMVERIFFRQRYEAEAALLRFSRECAYIERADREPVDLRNVTSVLGNEGFVFPMAVRGVLAGALVCGPRIEA